MGLRVKLGLMKLVLPSFVRPSVSALHHSSLFFSFNRLNIERSEPGEDDPDIQREKLEQKRIIVEA